MTKDAYVNLAKKAVATFVKSGQILPVPKNLPQKMLTQKAGVFVSIHKKSSRGRSASGGDGSLRGCIGTFLPTKKNIAEEIIYNSIAAASRDPRFPPIIEKELTDLKISVDILSSPKPAVKKDLNPQKYGLIVSAPGGRQGLLLPDIPGVETVKHQIEICQRKAGIFPGEKVSFQIFTVDRHS